MILWLHTRILRTYWRFKYRNVREQARHEELTPELLRWVYANTGHLNTAESQRAEVLWRRATPYQRVRVLPSGGSGP